MAIKIYKDGTWKTISGITGNYEVTDNKKQSLTTSSTDYPSCAAVKDALSNKQDKLISTTNIKTINGNSVLGSGNMEITSTVTGALTWKGVVATENDLPKSGQSNGDYWYISDTTTAAIWSEAKSSWFKTSGSGMTIDASLSSTSVNAVQNKVIYTALQGKQDLLSTTNKLSFDYINFTTNQINTINCVITSTDVDNVKTHLGSTDNPHKVTKNQVGLNNVVDTGDSATPVSGGTTKFTTGGAYTELNKKVNKSGDTMTGSLTISNGWLKVTNSSGFVEAPYFNATSDRRLKENITNYTPSHNILDLPIYKYDFIDGAKDQIGCMAQELKVICPEIVHENEDGYLTIQESKIVYLLLEEVKKLKQEVAELKRGK